MGSQIGHPEITRLVSNSIDNLVEGELIQAVNKEKSFEQYCCKIYLKTASLIANSSMAVAILTGCNNDLINSSYLYGKYLGMAFQVIDDLIDVDPSCNETGKQTFI